MIDTTIYPFTNTDINTFAPESPGVYALFQGKDLTYYGHSDKSIKLRLKSHKAGQEGVCTENATHFQCELAPSPLDRERELLNEYENEYGQLPRCNDVRP